MFVVFEGPEGCGKSTQARLAEEALKAKGHEVVVAREPGGTPLGERLRKILLRSEDPIDMRAEMLLYMASRAQLVEETIRPALEEGKTVLCERFLSSTLVYQGFAGGDDVDTIRSVGEYATGGLRPDLTIVIDIDTDTGLDRVTSPDRVESRGTAYHEKVKQGFLELAEGDTDRYVVIDGRRTIEEIHEDIMKAIEARRT